MMTNFASHIAQIRSSIPKQVRFLLPIKTNFTHCSKTVGVVRLKNQQNMFKKLNNGGSEKENAADAISTGDTAQKLRETEQILNKKQTFLEEQISEQLKIVHENCKANKPVAKQALIKKHKLQKSLEDCTTQLATLKLASKKFNRESKKIAPNTPKKTAALTKEEENDIRGLEKWANHQ